MRQHAYHDCYDSVSTRLFELIDKPINVIIGTLYLEYPQKIIKAFIPMIEAKYRNGNKLINLQRSN